MRISFIQATGFRGIRNPLRIEIPAGFAVVTGRNGSGKSSLWDAIEFTLTGTLRKYDEGSEKGESVADYLWWRGDGPVEELSVAIGLMDEEGQETTIRRDPRGVTIVGPSAERMQLDEPSAQLRTLLCRAGPAPLDALDQICRTSIIRDETLGALSVDLQETERFAFVKSALGSSVLDTVEQHGKAVAATLKKRTAEILSDYEAARAHVASLVAQLADARSGIANTDDLRNAEANLRRTLAADDLDAAALQATARRRLVDLRQRNDRWAALAIEAARARDLAAHIQDGPWAASRSSLIEALETARAKHARIESERQTVQQDLAQRVSPSVAGTLATLLAHGRELGLRNGACPLCGSELSQRAFEERLNSLSAEIDRQARELGELNRKREALDIQAAEATRDALSTEVQLSALESAVQEARETLNRVRLHARELGLEVGEPVSLELFDEAIRRNREEVLQIESAVTTLEASAAVDRVTQLEQTITTAQRESAALERRLRETEEGEARSKAAVTGIRRAINELIDERLASLAPLFQDLYVRLRPHTDWEEIRYLIRGDVRRFLSLRVGDNMNPRFVFSSGQRRAAGLAFLLAVHLSRPWCRLQTLILDDPVQHIDDFRALHFVEVLANIRREGRQILCAVEDEALATLLCRRLRGDGSAEGVLVKMAYVPGEGARVTSTEPIPATKELVVLSA